MTIELPEGDWFEWDGEIVCGTCVRHMLSPEVQALEYPGAALRPEEVTPCDPPHPRQCAHCEFGIVLP